ncbi:hypothetical protein MXB_2786 [Myxobolus squamalis]|nr:hypothetical protein MXB_2786 [Myxobolus squamalis]
MIADVDEDLWDQNFEKYPGLLVVDFHAHWCDSCVMLDPFLEMMANEYPWMKIVKLMEKKKAELREQTFWR